MTRIYTKTGDDGTTSLGTRERVAKSSLRVCAYGEIDELNSLIGAAIALDLEAIIEYQLRRAQNELFNLGTELAFSKESDQEKKLPQIERRHSLQLERDIDKLSKSLGPLKNFILPGGSPSGAALQVARAVCRRAERTIISLNLIESINPEVLVYINRLSDALFVMARYENLKKGSAETLWDSSLG